MLSYYHCDSAPLYCAGISQTLGRRSWCLLRIARWLHELRFQTDCGLSWRKIEPLFPTVLLKALRFPSGHIEAVFPLLGLRCGGEVISIRLSHLLQVRLVFHLTLDPSRAGTPKPSCRTVSARKEGRRWGGGPRTFSTVFQWEAGRDWGGSCRCWGTSCRRLRAEGAREHDRAFNLETWGEQNSSLGSWEYNKFSVKLCLAIYRSSFAHPLIIVDLMVYK